MTNRVPLPPHLGTTEADLWTQRYHKIEQLEKLGIAAYRPDYDCQGDIPDDLAALPSFEEVQENPESFTRVRLAGRQVLWREHGRICFGQIYVHGHNFQYATVRDITTVTDHTPTQEVPHQHVYRRLIDLGDYIGVEGVFCTTKKGELTLLATEITLLSKSLRPLPEKHEGLQNIDARQRERQLDMIRRPSVRKRFVRRGQLLRAIRATLDAADFVEMETPTLQAQAGGAMAEPFITHHNALDHDFYLRIALELDLKIATSGGIERTYEIGRCYRNEGIDPSHLQEFTMLEWYASYMTFEQNIALCSELLRVSCRALTDGMTVTIADPDGTEHEIDLSEDFPRKTFPDLLREHAGVDFVNDTLESLQDKARSLGVSDIETKSRAILLDDIYKKTARPKIITPTIITHYPSDLKPLAHPNPDGTAQVFQIVLAGWEAVNSYAELINPIIQRQLLETQSAAKQAGDAEAMELDERFLKAMEHGFPPMAGSGMGIDRVMALFLGLPNLRETVLFPTLKPEAQ